MTVFAIMFVLMLPGGSASAQSNFADRLKQSEIASRTEAGKAYQAQIASRIIYSPKECEKINSSYAGSFSLVGNILPTGKFSDVEVQPKEEASECIANAFRKMRALPRPPEIFGGKGFPFGFTQQAPIP